MSLIAKIKNVKKQWKCSVAMDENILAIGSRYATRLGASRSDLITYGTQQIDIANVNLKRQCDGTKQCVFYLTEEQEDAVDRVRNLTGTGRGHTLRCIVAEAIMHLTRHIARRRLRFAADSDKQF